MRILVRIMLEFSSEYVLRVPIVILQSVKEYVLHELEDYVGCIMRLMSSMITC
jgi:hypothetical protein